jgi:NADH dehydrogenase (ubiquinone) Fe-S protein 1
VYLVGADELGPGALPPGAFVVYQGHHGDRGAQLADLVLPGAAYTEKDGTWMNMEGRLRRSRAAVPPPGDARPDWHIVRALAEVTGVPMPYAGAADVQQRLAEALAAQADTRPVLAALEALARRHAAAPGTELRSPVEDYYLTDCISRASPTMAACSRAFPV